MDSIQKIRILIRRQGEALLARQAILDKAIEENRGLNEAEKGDSKRYQQAVSDYEEQIAFYRQVIIEQGDGEALRSFDFHHSGGVDVSDPFPGGQEETRQIPTGPEFIDIKTGEKLRALQPKDSYYRSREYQLPDGIRPSELSLGRLLRAAYTGDWQNAQAELRVMGGSGSSGNYLIPEPLSALVIDQVRNATRVVQAGALQIPMERNELGLARVKKDPVANWVGENHTIPSSDVQFDLGTMKAYKNAVILKVSEELFQDAANLDSLIPNLMATAIALEIDRAALLGSGVGEPLGVMNTKGMRITEVSGLQPKTTIAVILAELFYLMGKNADLSKVSALYNADFAQIVALMQDDSGAYLNKANSPESYRQIKDLVTNQIPTSEGKTKVAFGDFSNLLIGIYKDLSFELTRHTTEAFEKAQVWIRMMYRGDSMAIRETMFSRLDVTL